MSDKKTTLRMEMKAIRGRKDQATLRSEVIFHRLRELDFYALAYCRALYASFRSEVETQSELVRQLADSHSVILPRCYGDELRLFRIASMSELQRGAFGIPEPNDAIVLLDDRRVDPVQVDVFVVPGLGFDRRGNRLGHGKGHYDRLLSQASPNSVKVGICFDCQLTEELPTEPHDIRLDWIITESETICTRE